MVAGIDGSGWYQCQCRTPEIRPRPILRASSRQRLPGPRWFPGQTLHSSRADRRSHAGAPYLGSWSKKASGLDAESSQHVGNERTLSKRLRLHFGTPQNEAQTGFIGLGAADSCAVLSPAQAQAALTARSRGESRCHAARKNHQGSGALME